MTSLRIRFELDEAPMEEMIDSFSMGHITISGDQGELTSHGQTPDQSMMIFLSVISFLDSIRKLL